MQSYASGIVIGSLHRKLPHSVPKVVNLQQPPPHRGPGPQCQRFPTSKTHCGSFRFSFRQGTRPLAYDVPDYHAQAYASMQCSGAATHQHRETVVGRPATELRWHYSHTTGNLSCSRRKRIIAIPLTPLVCNRSGTPSIGSGLSAGMIE